MTNPHKSAVDALSIGTAIGTMANILPAIAALFTIIWTTIRIYETRTVQAVLVRIGWKRAESLPESKECDQ